MSPHHNPDQTARSSLRHLHALKRHCEQQFRVTHMDCQFSSRATIVVPFTSRMPLESHTDVSKCDALDERRGKHGSLRHTLQPRHRADDRVQITDSSLAYRNIEACRILDHWSRKGEINKSLDRVAPLSFRMKTCPPLLFAVQHSLLFSPYMVCKYTCTL